MRPEPTVDGAHTRFKKRFPTWVIVNNCYWFFFHCSQTKIYNWDKKTFKLRTTRAKMLTWKKNDVNKTFVEIRRWENKKRCMFYWNWNFLPRLNHSPKKISTLLRGFCGFIAIELVCKLVRKKKTGSYFFIILVTLLSIKGEAIRDIDTIILILKLSVSGLVQKKKREMK